MNPLKYINKQQLITTVVGGLILLFIVSKLTKRKKNADGTLSAYIGHDSIGWI